jgi:hypothetical protein
MSTDLKFIDKVEWSANSVIVAYCEWAMAVSNINIAGTSAL